MTIKIGQKILLGFAFVVLLTLGMGWYGLSKMAEVREITSDVAEHDLRVLTLVQDISHTQDEMRVLREKALGQYMLRKAGLTNQEPTIVQAEWHRAKEQTEALLAEQASVAAEYGKIAISLERRAHWEKIRQHARETRETLQQVADEVERQFELMNRGEMQQLAARIPILEDLRQAFNGRIRSGKKLIQETVDQGKLAAARAHEESKNATLIALIGVLLLGTVSSVVIQRSISRPLNTFMQFVEQVGQGDLTQQAAASNGDELGRLGQSLNQMVAGLKDVAGQTRAATQNLNAAAAEILASTQQQAASTSEQSVAVQQTTATMEEIRQSGAQISERATQVATAAEATSTASHAGVQAVQGMTRAMEAIREQAEELAENIVALSEKTQAVGEIIGTVNDIAEQSNLLALNAAIEAASAGEQGRGFSVVASEMKNLADQAKGATVQVRSILEEIQKGINRSVMLTEEAGKRVELGREQVDVAEGTIRQMASSIQESVQVFQQIVAGTNQQQIGFDQVTQAIQNVRQATEQTAASIRQLEKAAADLNVLGQQLRTAVERYRV